MTAPVKPQVNLNIQPVILTDSNGNNAATTIEYVQSDIANANLVWQQASIQFNTLTPILLPDSADLTTSSVAQRQALTSLVSAPGAFKVYYVSGCTDDLGLLGRTCPTGVVICMVNRNNTTTLTIANLAHELGPAQGLPDVNNTVNLMTMTTSSILEADITIAQVNSLTTTSSQ
jgi:hypothetical protein